MTTTVQVTPNHAEHLKCEALTQHYDSTFKVTSEVTQLMPLGVTTTVYVSDGAQVTISEGLKDPIPETDVQVVPDAFTFAEVLNSVIGHAIANGDPVTDIVAHLNAELVKARALID